MLGVVFTRTRLPDDEVIHQYNPFTTGYPAASGPPTPGDLGCPAVGRRLDRHRAVHARGDRPGERDARAHRGHHRHCEPRAAAYGQTEAQARSRTAACAGC